MTVFISFIKNRFASFLCACRGLYLLITTQTHGRLHALATVLVVLLAWLFRLGSTELALVLFATALVWMAEALNTAVERLADVVMPEEHPLIGEAKDLAAGAVLVAALVAALIGLLVFVPHLFCRVQAFCSAEW